MSLSRTKLQMIRWTSAALGSAVWVAAFVTRPEGGWAVLSIFGMLILGAPGALITLHLMDPKAKVNRK